MCCNYQCSILNAQLMRIVLDNSLWIVVYKMHREDDEYCELIYECLYEEGIAIFNELSDSEFKKLIRKQYNYIKIAKEGFY